MLCLSADATKDVTDRAESCEVDQMMKNTKEGTGR